MGSIVFAVGIAIGIASLLRFTSPKSQIGVSAFEVLAADQKLSPSGKVLADLLVDNLHRIIEEASRFSGQGGSRKGFRSVPGMPHIPVDTSYGIEFKGISLDKLVATWKHIRYREFLVSGDLLLGSDADGVMRVRYATEGSANNFEASVPEINATNVEQAVSTLSLKLMEDINPEVAARYLIATYLHCNGDCKEPLDTAIHFCRDWSKKDPKNAVAFFWLGYILTYTRYSTDGLPILDHALALDKRLDSALNTQGFVLTELGEYGDADKKFRAVLRIRPSPMAMNNLGANAQYRGEYGEAEKWYRKGLNADAEMAMLYSNLGNVLLQQARYAAAADAYGQADFLQPGRFDTLSGLVLSLVKSERVEEALQKCQKAARLDPGSANVAALSEGVVYLKTNHTERAIYRFQGLVHSSVSKEAKTQLGMAYLQNGEGRLAFSVINDLLSSDPRSPRLHILMAKILEALGDHERAKQHLAKSEQLWPGFKHILLDDL
jgi:tetratricopeptide (TPR) repeat protein